MCPLPPTNSSRPVRPTCQCYQHSPAPPPSTPPRPLSFAPLLAPPPRPPPRPPLRPSPALGCLLHSAPPYMLLPAGGSCTPLPTAHLLPPCPPATMQASLDAALKEVDAKFGKLDVLICAAGILGEMQLPQSITEDNW